MRDACCKFLLSQLDPSNCLGIRGFADTHSCSDLLKSAHKYVLQHFVEVAKTEEFMLLPLKQVRCCWRREGVSLARLCVVYPGRHGQEPEGPTQRGQRLAGKCSQNLCFGPFCLRGKQYVEECCQTAS